MSSSENVRIQAQLISSIQIDKTTCFEWIKEQMDNIASEHFRAAKYNIEDFSTKEKFERYTPAKKIVRIDKVLNKHRVLIQDYDLIGGDLLMSYPDDYTLMYYALPDKPATATSEIDMPLPYVNALKFYIAARIRARLTGQGNADAVSFYEEYTKAIQAADLSMMRQNNRYRRMPPARRGV